MRKFLDAAKDLQRNAEDCKREPAKEHEHPVRKGANFTAAMAFEMASTNLVLKLSIIKRRHQLRQRVAFILADLIVPPILSIYRAALRISDGANSMREQQRLDDYPNL